MKTKMSINGLAICMALVFVLSINQTAMAKDETVENQELTEKHKIIDLPDAIYLTINIGDAVRYTAKVHYSVGLDFDLIFDQEAFKLDYDAYYDYPEMMQEPGACGGDSATRIYTLRSTKKGKFQVQAIQRFHNEIEDMKTYFIIVE